MNKTSFEEEINQNGYLVYSTVGSSMLPLLHEHEDIVMVEKPKGRVKKYDVVLYKRKDNHYILHRVMKVREEDYVICGDHNIAKEYGIKDEDILGVMKEFVRYGKQYSISNKGYQFYSKMIVDGYYIKAFFLTIRNLFVRIYYKALRIAYKIYRTLIPKKEKSIK